MYFWLLETALINALVVCLLAACVFTLGRYVKRPALLHALWILVLVKLVTPPLVELPIGFRLDPLSGRELLAASDPETIDSVAGDQSPASEQDTRDDAKPSAAAENDSPHSNAVVIGSNTVANDQRTSFAAVLSCVVPFSPESIGQWMFAICIAIWLTGSAIWFLVVAWRLFRFSRFLRYAPPASTEINVMARRLAAEFGVPRTPDVRVVDSRFSPMLWAAMGGPKIILPTPLLDRLDAAAIESLLVHELAHYRRRDYLVRVLEIVVTGLFWWHPVVWLAKSEIESNEEQCCDAWVVDHLAGRPRPYAEALLATIDFLAEGNAMRLAPGATGLGDARIIRQRMQMIFTGVTAKSMTDSIRRAVIATSVFVLAIGPQVFAVAANTAVEAAVEASELTEVHANEPKATASVPERPTVEIQASVPVKIKPREPAYKVPPVEPFVSDVRSWARAMSPQRQMEVVALTNQTTQLIDHCLHHQFDISRYKTTAVAYSPDEEMVALASSDAVVYLIECDTGELLARWTGPESEIRTVDISPDGKLLAAGTARGKVHLFEIASRSELATFDSPAAVNSVRFSPNGQRLAVSSGSWMSPAVGELAIWNVATGEVDLVLSSESAQGIAAFAESDRLAAVDWDGLVTLYDLSSRRSTSQIQIDKDLVAQAEFSPVNDTPLVDAVEAALERQVGQLPQSFIYDGQLYQRTPDGFQLVVPELNSSGAGL